MAVDIPYIPTRIHNPLREWYSLGLSDGAGGCISEMYSKVTREDIEKLNDYLGTNSVTIHECLANALVVLPDDEIDPL